MIRCEHLARDQMTVRVEDVEAAFVDRDWFPASGGEVPALAVGADGALCYHGEEIARGADPEWMATALLSSFVDAVVSELAGTRASDVVVLGSGARQPKSAAERTCPDPGRWPRRCSSR